MAKRYVPSAQYLKPDPKYNNKLVSKFINCLMWDGKKSVAQRVMYDAMDVIAKRINDTSPLDVFQAAIGNVKPLIEVRSRRVGGASYQVPMQVDSNRQRALAFRWILAAARGKKGKPMYIKLADELIAAYKEEGAAMTTRENVHRMADANKAFAHFAW
jgi:small subunit ribosomal protein S7